MPEWLRQEPARGPKGLGSERRAKDSPRPEPFLPMAPVTGQSWKCACGATACKRMPAGLLMP